MHSNQRIIVSGKTQTDDIKLCIFNGKKYTTTFKSGNTYAVNRENIKYPDLDPAIDPETVVFQEGGYIEQCSPIKLQRKRLFSYFKEIAGYIKYDKNKGKDKDNEEAYKHIEKQYEQMDEIDESSVLAKYFDRTQPLSYESEKAVLIYPFSMNKSQKEAVERAFSSQVSIIQGPPGTGKTQTILNIAVNAVLKNKRVAVVSNNNPAVKNVQEKLERQGLGFITAYLGNKDNKKEFLKNQSKEYPDMSEWKLEEEEVKALYQQIEKRINDIDIMLLYENRVADLEHEIHALETEYFHFKEHTGTKPIPEHVDTGLEHLALKELIFMWMDCEYYHGKPLRMLRSLVMRLRYGRTGAALLQLPLRYSVSYIQNIYYNRMLKELQTEKRYFESALSDFDFQEKFKEVNTLSMRALRAALSDRYSWEKSRKVFSEDDFSRISEKFTEEYPVILSSTHSIKTSLSPEYIYDYVIIDEASQVDLATAVLAFSAAKNVIIVGDVKQLPNIVGKDVMPKAEKTGVAYRIEEQYDYTRHSILTSAMEIWKEAPETLLREHYRCHPLIAGFFNKKFYDGQLIIMRTDQNRKDVLKIYRTVEGNHAREHINQRQIDVIKKEVLPELQRRSYEEIGIISPYSDQKDKLIEQIKEDIEIDTVHKFQGREKDAIILTSVEDKIGDFVDNPSLLNVAVSRAKENLSVIISNDEHNMYTNYGDLVRYAVYHNLEVVDSKITSIFDLLYKQYEKQREEYLKKRKRIFKSEDLVAEELAYSIIEQVLAEPEFSDIDCTPHYALHSFIKDASVLNEKEQRYALNEWTHVDFILQHKLDKAPLAAVEIDGVEFHKEGTVQAERDRMKDAIFDKYNIPLLRIRTDESGEEERIRQLLRGVI